MSGGHERRRGVRRNARLLRAFARRARREAGFDPAWALRFAAGLRKQARLVHASTLLGTACAAMCFCDVAPEIPGLCEFCQWRERLDFAIEHPEDLSTAQHAALLQLVSHRMGDFA